MEKVGYFFYMQDTLLKNISLIIQFTLMKFTLHNYDTYMEETVSQLLNLGPNF